MSMNVRDNLAAGKYENKVPYTYEPVPVDPDRMTVRQAEAHKASEADKAGGYNRDTLEKIGVFWPPPAAWKVRAVGRQISNRDYQAALKAKDTKRHVYRGNTRRL